ncbi:DUF3343 domain-containing protein [Verrucomicrobiota bacterium]
MADERCIAVFPSTHTALKAERTAKGAGIGVRMVPVPRRLSPDCNMGMEAARRDRDSLEAVLAEAGVECSLVDWE